MAINSNEDNVFKVNAKVFLEGIEVPYSSVSVSYGIDSEPSCTIALPGSITLRDLPESTTVLVLYKEPHLPQDENWYVLFDGELESWTYGIDSTSATINLSAIHGTKWLNLMQLIIQEATAKASGMDNIAWSGNPEAAKVNGTTLAEAAILEGLFPKDMTSTQAKEKFKGMSDIVYCLMRTILSPDLFAAETTTFFRDKIEGQYNLHNRIYGTASNIENVYKEITNTIKVKNPSGVSGNGSQPEKTENYGKPKADEKISIVKTADGISII